MSHKGRTELKICVSESKKCKESFAEVQKIIAPQNNAKNIEKAICFIEKMMKISKIFKKTFSAAAAAAGAAATAVPDKISEENFGTDQSYRRRR